MQYYSDKLLCKYRLRMHSLSIVGFTQMNTTGPEPSPVENAIAYQIGKDTLRNY